MSLLRLTQHTESPDHYRVELALEGDGQPRQTANPRFEFKLDEQDDADVRWYMEDFLQYPLDPAPTMAARIEQRMTDLGTQLFKAVFQSDDDGRDLWAVLRERLNDTRIEVVTEVQEATSIPWELLRDPKTDVPLALRAQSFVRAQPNPAQRPSLPSPVTPLSRDGGGREGAIRILLVICRPGGRDDVPFRSVANRIIKGLTEEARARFQLDVLRPPTFEQLGKVLRAAKQAGRPYHIVHFDGHGLYAEPQAGGVQFNRILFNDNRPGKHGYLAFENSQRDDNLETISGPQLGALLVETQTPVLVLNACRSAHADSPAPTLPSPVGEASTGEGAADQHSQVRASPSPVDSLSSTGEGRVGADNQHSAVRAFGSLAQEVMDAGVTGVVAMRYNVYVVTAAQFVADLYAALAQGQSLGEAVTLGRKQLAAQPLRTIAYDPIPLQDWPVPIVYEAAPIQLFPKQTTSPLTVSLQPPTSNLQHPEDGLPASPDAGFFGRDETLLALDRAFDTQSIVLLHAFAGSGKTTTAVEFARWYAQTGGLAGPVLFTSFETLKPLPRVLDDLGRVFEQVLEANKIPWLALSDAQRREIALAIMQQIPVLWIWDNVEPIAGFPAGTPSMWTAAEQQALADFLRAARETKARFLLTSRRDERAWLGNLPARLTLPPMPMQERVQLARALADKASVRFTTVQDWRPLLDFTQGNPLTLTVVVGQALRERITTADQITAFVAKLRAGETVFEDEQTEGRSKSLGASLSYGFTTAFTEDERKVLALLHFFQGFVDVRALRLMGNPKVDYCLSEVRGLTAEVGIALLDRAAEVGLLTAHGSGFYSIHPVLPWYFKSLFDQYYGDQRLPSKKPQSAIGNPTGALRSQQSAMFAFVSALGELSNYYWLQYEHGNRDAITLLEREEDNLLHARRLALRHAHDAAQSAPHGWWDALLETMQGLHQLYGHTGRRAEWKALVDEIVPDFVDMTTDGPLSVREEQWNLVTQYRVWLAQEARQWAEAERLQRVQVEWARRRAAPALALPSPLQGEGQGSEGKSRNAIRTLAVSIGQLGNILCEQGKAECVSMFEEAIPICQRIGDKPEEAILAFDLGYVYKSIPALRDLAQAERWYRRSLELRAERDRQGRARCIGELGHVAWEFFKDARTAKQPEADLLRHLNEAVGFYQQALTLLPLNAVDDLAVMHNQLGILYAEARDFDRSLPHFREAVRYHESAGNLYAAAGTRFNVAYDLANARRLDDALLYAQAALRNFATFGDRAAAEIQKTQGLIAEIQRMKDEGGRMKKA